MTSVVVIQARTSSSRLPGKSLLPLGGLPMAVLAAKRAGNTGRDVILATSDEQSDDALASAARKHNVDLYRGSLANPLQRIVRALDHKLDETIVFRLTADNVFPDGAFLDVLEQEFIGRRVGLLRCNGEYSGVPYGMSAEVTLLGSLREADRFTSSAHDQEHVTPYLARALEVAYSDRYAHLGLGAFRCTIDSLDDYLGIETLFSTIENSVTISALSLMERLRELPYQPIFGQAVPKLVLGAAQLGFRYGIANTAGRPSEADSAELIKTSVSNGVEYIDTARAYGDSETVIGAALSGGWEGRASVITKLAPLDELPPDAPVYAVRAAVAASVYRSCFELRQQSLGVLLCHRHTQLSAWDGAARIKLEELLEEGLIGRLGVSVQNPVELEQALQYQTVSFIQMPFNILDWRWHDTISLIQACKAKRRLSIHVRSVLLQGLLANDDAKRWPAGHVRESGVCLDWLGVMAKQFKQTTKGRLCINFARAQEWVDGVVIGVDEACQLRQNIEAFCQPALSPDQIKEIMQSRPKVSRELLNPAEWS